MSDALGLALISIWFWGSLLIGVAVVSRRSLAALRAGERVGFGSFVVAWAATAALTIASSLPLLWDLRWLARAAAAIGLAAIPYMCVRLGLGSSSSTLSAGNRVARGMSLGVLGVVGASCLFLLLNDRLGMEMP